MNVVLLWEPKSNLVCENMHFCRCLFFIYMNFVFTLAFLYMVFSYHCIEVKDCFCSRVAWCLWRFRLTDRTASRRVWFTASRSAPSPTTPMRSSRTCPSTTSHEKRWTSQWRSWWMRRTWPCLPAKTDHHLNCNIVCL